MAAVTVRWRSESCTARPARSWRARSCFWRSRLRAFGSRVPRQRRNNKAIAAVLLVAIVFGIATMIVRANAGPPGYIRWQNLPQSLKDGKETTGGVQIELVPGDDNMKLIIPLRKTKEPGEE